MIVVEVVPKMVWFIPATTHDYSLLSKLKLDPNTIYTFEKGYYDYEAFQRFCDHQTGFVTRINDNTVFESGEKHPNEEYFHSGVKEDEIIILAIKNDNNQNKPKLREI